MLFVNVAITGLLSVAGVPRRAVVSGAAAAALFRMDASANAVESKVGGEIVYGEEALMSQKQHGTTAAPVQKNLRWGVDRDTADRCRHYEACHERDPSRAPSSRACARLCQTECALMRRFLIIYSRVPCSRRAPCRICSFNRHYAEYAGYWKKTNFLTEVKQVRSGMSPRWIETVLMQSSAALFLCRRLLGMSATPCGRMGRPLTTTR